MKSCILYIDVYRTVYKVNALFLIGLACKALIKQIFFVKWTGLVILFVLAISKTPQ